MKQSIILMLMACLFSCSNMPRCKNDNPVFDQYGPISNEYKAELVRQLQSGTHPNIRYWIDKYTEINGKPFMTVFIQGDGLCAMGYIDIKNPNKMQHFKNVKGISYSGAEIRDFQYAIDTLDGKIIFLFEEGNIID